MQSFPITSSTRQDSGYAKLIMDGRGLLLPQHEVLSLESIQDLERTEATGNGLLGWMPLAGEQVPVYCLSAGMEPMQEIPENHRLIALLQDRNGVVFGILCNDVVAMECADLRILPLPDCMRLPETSVLALALDGEEVLCVSTSNDLTTLIARSMQPSGGAIVADAASSENIGML